MADRRHKRRPRRGWTWLGRTVALSGLVALVAVGALYGAVVVAPSSLLSRDDVQRLLSAESPVFYRDGKTRIGVFFEDQHRRLVHWEDIPPTFVAAVLAAEDARFWTHEGFDLAHITRAMHENWEAGTVVSGGSTISQQAAKNLFGRKERTVRAKVRELVHALRLEHRFPKEDIFTFYANQFHVTGNGRGLGIAAQHFFDQEPRELDVLQAAFIAGLLKAPARYDVFARDAATREEILERSHARTRYVLERIVEVPAEQLAGPPPDPWTTDAGREAYEARVAEMRAVQRDARRHLDEGFELSFKRGSFRFEPTAVLDEVARRLAEAPFDQVLEDAGIDDPRTAGLQIVTTLDEQAQRAATYGLWHHLTEVGVMLDRLGPADIALQDTAPPRIDPNLQVAPRDVRVGRVAEKGASRVVVDLGGRTCEVDEAGVQRIADAIRRGRSGSAWVKAGAADRARLASELPADAVVLVSIRAVEEDRITCDLEVRPALQGAAVVVQDGQLRAMVGGSDNRFFNRATALRQMGSAWKPIIMHAAMHLGWSADDLLSNDPASFAFSTTVYTPRKGHAAPSQVSLAYAGTKSENVASVWLLYHLTDHLSHEETARLAELVGLAPEPGEDPRAWQTRMNRSGVRTPSASEAMYTRARQRVLARLRTRHAPDLATLAAMVSGERPTGEEATVEPAVISEGEAPPEPVDPIRAEMARDSLGRRAAAGELDAYQTELFYWSRDFRVLLGMRYVTMLAEQYGVVTDLEEVLSLPLGGTEITLEEATMLYDGMSSGETWHLAGRAGGREVGEPPAPTLLIQEIRDRDGEVIYRAVPEPVRIASPAVAAMTRDILRNVVEHGTGRRAKGLVERGGAQVPLFGKTGTTNDNRNAAFFGYVPTLTAAGLDDLLTVGVYVGYDMNEPMVRRGVRLQGANGALPGWIEIVRGLDELEVIGPRDLDAPPEGWRFPDPPGTIRHASHAGGMSILARPRSGVRQLEPMHAVIERPLRTAPSTEEAAAWEDARRRAADEDQPWSVWSDWEERRREAPAPDARPERPEPPEPPPAPARRDVNPSDLWDALRGRTRDVAAPDEARSPTREPAARPAADDRGSPAARPAPPAPSARPEAPPPRRVEVVREPPAPQDGAEEDRPRRRGPVRISIPEDPEATSPG